MLPQPEPMDQVRKNDFKILQCIHFTNDELFYAWLDSTDVASFSNLHWLCLTPSNTSKREVSNPDICKLEKLAKYLLYQYLRQFDKDLVRPEGKKLYYCWTFHGEMPFKAITDDVQAVDRLQNTWSADVSHDDPSALMQPALDSIWSTEASDAIPITRATNQRDTSPLDFPWSTEASDANPIERDTSPLDYFWSSEASEAIPIECDTSQRPWNWYNEGPSTYTHEDALSARESWNWSNEGPSTMNWSNEGPSTMNWSNQGY